MKGVTVCVSGGAVLQGYLILGHTTLQNAPDLAGQ